MLYITCLFLYKYIPSSLNILSVYSYNGSRRMYFCVCYELVTVIRFSTNFGCFCNYRLGLGNKM